MERKRESESRVENFLALGRKLAIASPRPMLAEEIVRRAKRQSRRAIPIFTWYAAAAAVILTVTAAFVGHAMRHDSESVPTGQAGSIVLANNLKGTEANENAEEGKTSDAISSALFQIRLDAARAAMIKVEPLPPPDFFMTATELYAQIPAIMLATADEVRIAGNLKEAERKYKRIIELYPESQYAKTAGERLATLEATEKEG